MEDSGGEAGCDASAALLLLDVAAAKASLAQLQSACAAAHEQHVRTRCQLQELQQETSGPMYTLPAAHGPAGARQLQALHAENLQLKAVLKQEVEARQQLEQRHAALLELIRRGDLVELLAAGSLGSPAAHGGPAPGSFGGSSKLAPASGSDTTSGALQQARRTSSTSSYSSSSSAEADSATARRRDQLASGCAARAPPDQAAAGQPLAAAGAAPCSPLSAYFPFQRPGSQPQRSQQLPQRQQPPPQQQQNEQEQQQPQQEQQTEQEKQQQQQQPQQQRQQQPAPGVGTWQEALQQGLFMRLVAQQGGAAFGGQPWQGVAAAAASRDSEHEDACSSQLSSSASASQLLDSDDLEELAGLCDGLRHQGSTHDAEQQQPVSAAAAAAAGCSQQPAHEPVAAAAGCSQQPPHEPPPTQQPAACHAAGCQDAGHQAGDAATGDGPQRACLPGMQALAAQLRHLQQQVAATAADPAAARNGSLDAPTVCAPTATQPGSAAGAMTRQPQASPSPRGRSGHEAATSTAGMADEAGIAGLQQHLAQRMAEVKQRLSSICSGMMHDSLAGGASPAVPGRERGGSPAGAPDTEPGRAPDASCRGAAAPGLAGHAAACAAGAWSKAASPRAGGGIQAARGAASHASPASSRPRVGPPHVAFSLPSRHAAHAAEAPRRRERGAELSSDGSGSWATVEDDEGEAAAPGSARGSPKDAAQAAPAAEPAPVLCSPLRAARGGCAWAASSGGGLPAAARAVPRNV